MVRPWRLGVAVLAAGASRRFGAQDKLTATLKGRRLGEIAPLAIPLDEITPAGAWVIASSTDHPCQPAWQNAGFGVIVNSEAGSGMGSSVACAAQLAVKAEWDALLIALADMPFVPSEHFIALIKAARGTRKMVASIAEGAAMPPAIIGRGRLARLADLRGDAGARGMLRQAELIECPPDWLKDIDTPDDLHEHDL